MSDRSDARGRAVVVSMVSSLSARCSCLCQPCVVGFVTFRLQMRKPRLSEINWRISHSWSVGQSDFTKPPDAQRRASCSGRDHDTLPNLNILRVLFL